MKFALLVRFSCLLATSSAPLQAQEKAAPAAPAQAPIKPSPKQKPAADPFIKAPGVVEEPASPPEPFSDIVLQYDWIDVPRDDFMALVRENPISPDATVVRRELQAWIQQGKAQLAQLDLLLTRSGQRSVSQSVREIRHPQFPSQLEAPEHGAGGKNVSFHSRQHGWEIEVEVVAGEDGRSFQLNCVPQWTEIGGEAWTTSKLPGAQPGDVLVPAIRVGKVTTSAVLQIDTWHLFWAGRAPLLPDAPVKLRVLFVRAALKTGPPAQPRPSTGGLIVETDWIDVPLTALNEWVFAQPLAEVPTGLPEQARSWLAAGKAKRRAADITPTQIQRRKIRARRRRRHRRVSRGRDAGGYRRGYRPRHSASGSRAPLSSFRAARRPGERRRHRHRPWSGDRARSRGQHGRLAAACAQRAGRRVRAARPCASCRSTFLYSRCVMVRTCDEAPARG